MASSAERIHKVQCRCCFPGSTEAVGLGFGSPRS
ncbi:hypothetical protein LINPERHAP1_LOCUS19706 [Linum perenne]